MKRLFGTISVICLLLGQNAMAGFPDWYPKEGFTNTGKIDELNSAYKTIIIDDLEYHYSEQTVVHSLSEVTDSLGRLRANTRVGFAYDVDKQGTKQLLEIWLLPESYKSSDD